MPFKKEAVIDEEAQAATGAGVATEEKVAVEEGIAVEQKKQSDDVLHLLMADRIVNTHVYGAMGVGLVPIPLVDLMGVASIQINMLRKLAKLYGRDFSSKLGRRVVMALVGGALPAVGALPFASMVKSIPLIGWTLGLSSATILSGASTYAVGKVFTKHFATDGELCDFDVAKAGEYFREEYQKGLAKLKNFRKTGKETVDAVN